MKKWAVPAAVCSVVLIVCMLLGIQVVKQKIEEAAPTLTAVIADETGIDLRIGRLAVTNLTTITLYQAEVYDKQGRKLAASPTVDVSYRIWSLLTNREPVTAISSVVISEPDLFLQQSQSGRWNVEDLLQTDSAQPLPFTGEIVVQAGRAEVTAYNRTYTLAAIDGTIDYAASPAARIKLTGQYKEAAVKAEGYFGSTQGSMLTVWADSLAVADFSNVLPTASALQVNNGDVKKLQVVWKKTQGKTTISGMASIQSGSIVLKDTAVEDIAGELAFNADSLYLFDVHTKIYQQPVLLDGNIYWKANVPLVDLRVTSPGFSLEKLPVAAELRGQAAGSATVKGNVDSPRIAAQLEIAAGSIAGWDITDGKVRAKLVDDRVTIEQASGSILGGQLLVKGDLNIKDGRYQIAASGKHINIGDFNERLSGAADFQLEAAGQGLPNSWQALDFAGQLRLPRAQISGLLLSDVSTGFQKQGNAFQLDYLNAAVEGGRIAAGGHGDIAGGALAISLYGQDLPLAAVGSIGGFAAAGTTDINGVVAGTWADPELRLNFTARQGQVLQQPFTEARGSLRMTPEQLQIEQAETVDAKGGRHRVVGTIGLQGQQLTDVWLVTKKVRAENLVALLAPGERLTGNVDNTLHLTGPLHNLEAEGEVLLTDGSFRGQLVARAEGRYQRHNGVTAIEKLLIDSLNTKVSVAGRLQADQQLDFTVTAHNIDLGKLHVNYPYPVEGQGSFSGTLTGKAAAPVFAGSLTTPALTLNHRKLQDLSAQLDYRNDEVTISALTFKQDGGTYDFHGGIDLNTLEVFGGVDVTNGHLAAILAVADSPFKEADGLLNGHIRIAGQLTHMDIWLNGVINQAKIKNYSLENIDLNAELVNNKLTIHTLSARQGTGMLAARGHAYVAGPIDMEIGARDIDAGLLSVLLDTDTQLQGTLDAAAQLSGTTVAPHVDMSAEIRQGSWGNAAFDSLYGLFMVDEDRITINQLLLAKGPYRASAYGTIPLEALVSTAQPHNAKPKEMAVEVRLDQANLSILPMLTPHIAWAQGETKGAVRIGGTLAKPTVNGNITVQNGVVKPTFLQEPIQQVAVDISCAEQSIRINRFSGKMGAGDYLLTGTAALQGMNIADYNITAELNKPMLTSKYFKGPLAGKLTLTSQDGYPKLAGQLLLENDTIDIPLIPEIEPSDRSLVMDVSVEAGDKVRLYNPYLYDMLVGGKVVIGGTLQHPAPEGRFRVKHGTVSYLQTKFKISEGRAEFNPLNGLEPTLALAAQTKLQNTTVDLAITGTLSQMNLQLSSNPSMSQADILSLLTLRSRFLNKQNGGSSSVSEDWMGLLDSGLQMRFVSEVENIFRSALGLDEFHVVRDTFSSSATTTNDSSGTSNGGTQTTSTLSKEGYNLEFGKYITNRFLLNYSLGIDHNAYKVEARYDFNRKLSITGKVIGGRDATPDQMIGLEARFRF